MEAPKLNKTKLSLKLGEKSTLKLKGTKQKVTWKSSKPSVVTVSQQGVVTAKQNGTARIVAKAGGVKFRCTITVKAKAVLSKEQATKAVRNYFAKEGWDYYFNGYEEKEGKYYTYFVTLRGGYTKFKYFVDTQTAKVYSTGPYRGIDEWKPSDPIYYRFNAYDYI